MKKILSLLLVVILSCGLFACGSKSNDDSNFSLGKVTGNSYKNDFIGVSCDLPVGWTYYDDKQILELNNMTGSYIDKEFEERLKNADIVYDMCAVESVMGNSININFEKVKVKNVNLKKNIEYQLDGINSTYANMGYSDILSYYQKVKVNGREYDGIKLSAKIEGVNVYVTGIMYQKGNYIVNIATLSIQDDTTESILSWINIE